MLAGVTTPNLDPIAMPTAVRSNDANGTGQTPIDSLATTLSATGALADLISALLQMTGAVVAKASLSELAAVAGSYHNGDIGLVLLDVTETKRGIYRLQGGTWVKIDDLPADIARAAVAAAQAIRDDAKTIRDDAEVQRIGAEAARDIAAGYASDAVSQGNVPIFATISGMSANSVKAGINACRVNGLFAAGDGWEGLYKRVAAELSEASPLRKFRSADRFLPDGSTDNTNGGWWSYSARKDILTNAAQYGLSVDNTASQNDAILDEIEASDAGAIFVPDGVYATNKTVFDLINKRYAGPGQFRMDGYAQAPLRSFITTLQPVPSTDRAKVFDGGFDKAHSASYSFVGSGANPAVLPTVYTNFLEWNARVHIHDFSGGFNTAPGDHALGRSGAFVDTLRLYFQSQGDLIARNFFGEISSTRAGATHWLAAPALAVENGNLGVTAGVGTAYLQHSEYIFSDNGNDISVIDRVRNYVRTNDTAALNETWNHDSPQSSGSKPIDAFYVPTGLSKRGLDLGLADFGAQKAAIGLKALDRIYFDVSSVGDAIGFKPYSQNTGQTFLAYDNTQSRLVLAVGNQPTLQPGINDVYMSKPWVTLPGLDGAALFQNGQVTIGVPDDNHVVLKWRNSLGVDKRAVIAATS